MPLNAYGFHWVFLVLINIGKILEKTGPRACVLFFDSANKALCPAKWNMVLDFLNSNWNIFYKDLPQNPFTKNTLPLFSPKGEIPSCCLPRLKVIVSSHPSLTP